MTEQDTSLLIQISRDSTNIAKDLATNTEATKNIEKSLVTLNGKVAHHESRLQAIEAAQAITATAVASIQQTNQQAQDSVQQAKNEKRSRLYDVIEKASWAIVSFVAIALWKVISYLIENDIIKHLIK